MLSSSPPKKGAGSATAAARTDDGSGDLRFISELGRSLVFTVHPKKVAARVADAIRAQTDARTCVFVAELENIGLISCAYDGGGQLDGDFLDRARFERWLSFMPPQIAYTETDAAEFLINDAGHTLEHVSPVHINGEIIGAVIASFASAEELNDHK